MWVCLNIRIFICFEKQYVLLANHTQLSEDHETGISADELKILETTNVDWNKTRELWIKSHSYRQNELQNNELSTIDYIQKYNIHLNENFHELVSLWIINIM